MKLTFFCHYPHRMGTIKTEHTFDESMLHLAMACVPVCDAADETVDLEMQEIIIDEIELSKVPGKGRRPMYAFDNMLDDDGSAYTVAQLRNQRRKILNSLDSKGFFVGEWEEGSYVLYVQGKKRPAMAALWQHEGKIQAEMAMND
jgi:hypothetical protein